MAYATQADIEEFYGAQFVQTNADRDQDQDATKIAAAITAALEWATEEIDAHLRGGVVKLPLATPVPSMIKDVCRKLAGAFLYSHRGAADFDAQSGDAMDKLHPIRRECYRKLARIAAGRIDLDVDSYELVPEIVSIDLHEADDLLDDSANWE